MSRKNDFRGRNGSRVQIFVEPVCRGAVEFINRTFGNNSLLEALPCISGGMISAYPVSSEKLQQVQVEATKSNLEFGIYYRPKNSVYAYTEDELKLQKTKFKRRGRRNNKNLVSYLNLSRLKLAV